MSKPSTSWLTESDAWRRRWYKGNPAHAAHTYTHTHTMRFCTRCDNMLYISLRPDESKDGKPLELTYSCKHCGFVVTANEATQAGDARAARDTAVLSTDYTDDQTSYKQHATPYLRFDPTLPRVSDIACANERCSRAEGAPNEVIEVKYDAGNLKYLYHCVHCLSFWKGGGTHL